LAIGITAYGDERVLDEVHVRQVGRIYFNRQFLPMPIRCRRSFVSILLIRPHVNIAYNASDIERPIELRALAFDLLVGMHRM
jgi:hypothetical protein